MARHLKGGCFTLLLIVVAPGLLVAYFKRSLVWIVVVPFGLIALAFAMAEVFGRKRKVTPQQFAEELERHLLGTEGPYDWDDATSVAFADERLELLRSQLWRFDTLELKERQEELRELIAALRRGEIPEFPADNNSSLTYGGRK